MRTFHRRLGIFLAFPAIWIVVTGIALGAAVYWQETHLPYRLPEQMRTQFTPRDNLSIQQRLEELLGLSKVQLNEIRGIVLAFDSKQSDRIQLKNGNNLFFAPTEVLAFAATPRSQWKDLLVSLHRGKFLFNSTIGRVVFSGTAFLIWILSVSSLFFFRARSRLKNARDVHSMNATGFGIFLLFIVGTGGLWNFSSEIRGWHPTVRPLLDSIDGSSIKNALLNAPFSVPGEKMRSLYFIEDYALIVFEDSSRVYFDLQGKERPSVYRPFTIQGWIEPLYDWHSGRFLQNILGEGSVILPSLAGLVLMVFIITGLQISRRRKKVAKLHLKIYPTHNSDSPIPATFRQTNQLGVK